MAEIIEGLAELLDQFRKLDLVLQRKTLIEAAKAGGEILRDEAARRAPRRSGDLAEGMTMRVARDSDIHQGSVDVGPDQFYGAFQESGTKHHRKQPFLGPAFDDNEERINEAISQTLADAIDQAIK